MVITMISTSNDLVEDNYYEEGVNFERKIQAVRNSKAIKNKIIVSIDKEYLIIEFPTEVKMNEVLEGTIHLFRPEDSKLDKHFGISIEAGNTQLIPLENIEKGNYKLLLSWKTKENDYYVDKDLLTI